MGDVLAQFGMFDLIAVLLSGGSAVTISFLFLKFACSVEIDFQLMGVESAAVLLLISYLCGLALQEIGSFCEKSFYHGGIWTAFDECEEQTSTLEHIKLTAEKEGRMAYEYCRHYIQDSKSMSRVDRYATTCVMSRSMATYFFLSSVYVIFSSVVPSQLKPGVAIASFVLGVMFFYRFYRFSKLRYNGIYQIFYYEYLVNAPKKEDVNEDKGAVQV